MKTASEAKTTALNARTEKATNELQHILNVIEKAAEGGSLSIAIKIKYNLPEIIIPQIEQFGYVVTQQSGLIVIDWS